MSRAGAIAAVLACAGLLGTALVASAPSRGADAGPRLLVTADEWSLGLSRSVLDPGHAIVQLYNRGEDAHDLRIRRVGRSHVTIGPETAPGEVSELTRRLRSGRRYKLWCSLAGHKELGMRAELRVRG